MSLNGVESYPFLFPSPKLLVYDLFKILCPLFIYPFSFSRQLSMAVFVLDFRRPLKLFNNFGIKMSRLNGNKTESQEKVKVSSNRPGLAEPSSGTL